MSMEDRITALEKDVDAIRSELAVMRHAHRDTEELIGRVARIELDLAIIKGDGSALRKDLSQMQSDVSQLQSGVLQLQSDVAQVQSDVSQVQNNVARLTDEVVGIRIELAGLHIEKSQYATRADLIGVQAKVKEVEANIKGWMLGIALTVMSLNFAMNVLFYNAQKQSPAMKPTQAQQMVRPASPVPLSSENGFP